MSSGGVGAVVGAGCCLTLAPYLGRLSLSVPDREDRRWWRGKPAGGRRLLSSALVAAALGALAGSASGWSALLPAFLVLAAVGVPLVVIDVEHHRLPNRLVATLAGAEVALLSVAALWRHDWHSLLRAGAGSAAVFGALFLIMFAAPGSFGYGDVKLGGVLGGYLGWFGWAYLYYGIFAGFLLGALSAVVLLATRRASLKTAISFGPMLVLGALAVLAFHLATPSGWMLVQ